MAERSEFPRTPSDSRFTGEVPNEQPAQAACQVCGGRLIELRAKLQCERCHTIWETCCEGGRQ